MPETSNNAHASVWAFVFLIGRRPSNRPNPLSERSERGPMNDIDAFIIIILLYTTIGHLYIDQYWGNRMKEAQEAIVYTLGASLFYIFAWLCWILGW